VFQTRQGPPRSLFSNAGQTPSFHQTPLPPTTRTPLGSNLPHVDFFPILHPPTGNPRQKFPPTPFLASLRIHGQLRVPEILLYLSPLYVLSSTEKNVYTRSPFPSLIGAFPRWLPTPLFTVWAADAKLFSPLSHYFIILSFLKVSRNPRPTFLSLLTLSPKTYTERSRGLFFHSPPPTTLGCIFLM